MAHATKQPVRQKKWSAKRDLNASRTLSPSCVSESLCSLLHFLLCLLTGSWQLPGSHLHSSLTVGRKPPLPDKLRRRWWRGRGREGEGEVWLFSFGPYEWTPCGQLQWSGQWKTLIGYAWVSGPLLSQSLWIRMPGGMKQTERPSVGGKRSGFSISLKEETNSLTHLPKRFPLPLSSHCLSFHPIYACSINERFSR